MLDVYETLETEVLVVGSGGAGSFAALGADEEGAEVLMLDRGVLTRSGATIMGGHTCCAALSPADSPKQHYEDTIAGGRLINDRRLVETFVNEAPERIREVDAYGAGFLKEDSGDFWLVSPPSGHSVVRSVHYGYRTGPAIMRGLRKELRRRGIKAVDNALLTSLLTSHGRIVGATALDLLSGRLLVCKSKTVVLATGGIGQLFAPWTTGPLEAGGDPLGMAYSVGAELVDMEFVQFLPAQIEPALRHISITLANLPGWRPAIRERTRLVNAQGVEFLHRYDPERGLDTTRDVRARAIYDEIQAGRGTPLGGVYLDMTRVPEDVVEEEFGARFPGSILKRMKKEGFVLNERPIEVSIHAHYLMGGLKINSGAESTVKGLFGAGEVTGGVHGANRLGGNALSEIMVFGRIAGVSAARYARQIPRVDLDMRQIRRERARLGGYFEQRGDPTSVSEVRSALQDCMWNNVSVRRDATGLARALDTIRQLRADQDRVTVGCTARAYNREWMEAIALAPQLDVAEAVAAAALERRESRGAHFRDDYPVQDDENWLKRVVLRRTDSGMKVFREPVVDNNLGWG